MIYFANEPNAKDIAENNSGIFIGLLKEQPPKGMEGKYLVNKKKLVFDMEYSTTQIGSYEYNGDWHTFLRYLSGKYDVKETWGKRWPYFDDGRGMSTIADWVFVYKADIPQAEWDKYQWHSPVTMPKEAIRWTIELETTVKRVSELTPKERCNSLGIVFNESMNNNAKDLVIIKEGFIKHWNSLHGKPVKKDNGYICYPYNNFEPNWISFSKSYPEAIRVSNGAYYKGKKLTIYPNPYIEPRKWRKV